MRILREPAPDATGGGMTTTQATPTTPTPPPPPPPPTASPPPPPAATITITPEEYRRHLDAQARLTEIEAESRRVAEEKEAARLKALAEKGQAEDALAQLRTNKDAEIQKERDRANTLEREILAGHTAVAISTALDGIIWVSDEAGKDARMLLEARFESVRDPATGVKTTREKGTGRPAADVIKEWRGSSASAHYQKSTTAGGAGAAGTHHAAGATPAETVEERQVRQLKEQVTAGRSGAPGLDGTYGRGLSAARNN